MEKTLGDERVGGGGVAQESKESGGELPSSMASRGSRQSRSLTRRGSALAGGSGVGAVDTRSASIGGFATHHKGRAGNGGITFDGSTTVLMELAKNGERAMCQRVLAWWARKHHELSEAIKGKQRDLKAKVGMKELRSNNDQQRQKIDRKLRGMYEDVYHRITFNIDEAIAIARQAYESAKAKDDKERDEAASDKAEKKGKAGEAAVLPKRLHREAVVQSKWLYNALVTLRNGDPTAQDLTGKTALMYALEADVMRMRDR